MGELIIYSGKLKGRRLILPDHREVVVGRDEACHMRIASSLVSRKHCVLKSCPDGVLVRDLESQNGTYVNDVAISEQFVMKPGDVLRVGSALFQVPAQIKPIPKPADQAKEPISDDDISSWISDTEQTTAPANPDTTVIKGRQPPPSTASMPTATAAASSAPLSSIAVGRHPAPPRTVKEQAAEIIKRHWEMIREK